MTARPARNLTRAIELDALRGLALFMMFGHHLMFDLRYLFALDVFAWQESWWFINLMRPFFLTVFLVVSGISSSFSRSNFKRGWRLLAVALGFTAATTVASVLSHNDFYILFNVLHLLAVGTLLYAGLSSLRWALSQRAIDATLTLATVVILYLGSLMPDLNRLVAGNWLTLPLGILPAGSPGMADYLPLFPWLGFFFAGVLIGRQVYADRQSAVPAPALKSTPIQAVLRPFAHLGRNSLLYYVLHQPVLLAILFGLQAIGWLG